MLSRKIELLTENEITDENNIPTLEIIQDLSYGYAGEVWDGALVLTHYLIKNKDFSLLLLTCFIKNKDLNFTNKNIIELGAGTGICGLTISSMYKANKVVITDLLVGLIDINIEKNKNLNKSNTVISRKLDWTNKNDYITDEVFDLIILCEVVWNPDLFEPLLNTLKSLVKKETKILSSYTFRKKNEIEFLKKLCLELNLKMNMISKDKLDQQYQSEDIFLMEYEVN